MPNWITKAVRTPSLTSRVSFPDMVPDQLVSGNGPQFISAEFAEFSKKYGFTHITSSPHYLQANGEAERAVQTVKGLLTKAKDPYKALMNYQNTPLEEINQSQAQLMMGRRLKTSLPTAAPFLKSRASDEVQRIMKKQKEKQKQYYDKRTGKELPPLQPGETAKVIHAKVTHKHQSPRSYVIESEQRQKYRRNCHHLCSSKLSEKEQRSDVKHANTKEPSVSSDKARATAKNAVGQSWYHQLTTQSCDNKVWTCK
ncbi:Tripartite motif-containing 29 [Paramuricea clavata]|uniref:Tripartite motif-containing 29 n=1 Tax=Paramuricea clavata TaxID=317549 RepID=A0A7D9DAX4_PARCT|nr:Tripartite motif-containing 29 [Paramuricea clavata]